MQHSEKGGRDIFCPRIHPNQFIHQSHKTHNLESKIQGFKSQNKTLRVFWDSIYELCQVSVHREGVDPNSSMEGVCDLDHISVVSTKLWTNFCKLLKKYLSCVCMKNKSMDLFCTSRQRNLVHSCLIFSVKCYYLL